MLRLLATALLLCSTAHAQDAMLVIPTRPGATVAVLEMRAAEPAKFVVIYLVGGSGQRGLGGVSLDDLPQDPDSLFGAQRQLARQVGAVVAVDTSSDLPVLEMIDRRQPGHLRDIQAVVDSMRQRHPGARIVLMGSSNGAYSAALLAKRLRPPIDAVVLINASPDSWDEVTHLPQPVLGIHHRRDACLHYRASYPKAHFFPLITVDDPAFPIPTSSTPVDCGPASAHSLSGKRSQVYRAIGAWLLSGKVQERIE